MDHMDMIKRNDDLHRLVGEEVANGQMADQILQNLRSSPEAEAVLIAAGGRYLQLQDTNNASLVLGRADPHTRLGGNTRSSEPHQCVDALE